MLRQNQIIVNRNRTSGGPGLPSTPGPNKRKSTPKGPGSAPGLPRRNGATPGPATIVVPPKIAARPTPASAPIEPLPAPFFSPKETSFPTFEDGDVIITLTASRVYQLHSPTLTAHSGFFKELLLSQNKGKKSQGTVRYRIHYVPSGQARKPGDFKLEEGAQHPVVEVENGRAVDEFIGFFSNIFRIMYELEPDFGDGNFGDILSDCIGLLDAAEFLETSMIIHRTVDRVLTNEGQSLYKSIQDAPLAWSDLGVRIQSANILREAYVHLIGKWGIMTDEEKLALRPEVQWLCARKHEELAAFKYAIELRMLEFHPKGVLMAAVKKQMTAPGRNAYAGRIYWWMNLGIFRSWLGKKICQGKGSAGPDGGTALFRQIAAAGEAYLGVAESNEFARKFPMSHKASVVMSTCMEELKNKLKIFVEPLMEDNTSLKHPDGKQLEYLTCAKIENADFPWNPKFGQTGRSTLLGHMKRLDPLEQFEMDEQQLRRFYGDDNEPRNGLIDPTFDYDEEDSFGLGDSKTTRYQPRGRNTEVNGRSRSRSRSPVTGLNGNANGHRERSPIRGPLNGSL